MGAFGRDHRTGFTQNEEGGAKSVSMKVKLLRDKKFYLILFWLAFTTLFAVWWMILGLNHVSLLEELRPEQSTHWQAQKRMLFWEGFSWIALLLIGGFTSVYFMLKEKMHTENLKSFFASFNHDVKTSLASLRLQAEALKEDLENTSLSPKILDRLISDTMRLQIQLENSLYMSTRDSQQLLLETRELERFIASARFRWPQLKIHLRGDALIEVDERAFVTVINNLIQNSIVHGGASEIHFEVKEQGQSDVEIFFYDNGSGYPGPLDQLGRLFYRPTSKSGTGMGLYICHELLKRMNGRFLVTAEEGKGFSAVFSLKGQAI